MEIIDFKGGASSALASFWRLRAFVERGVSVANASSVGAHLGAFFKAHPHLLALTFTSSVNNEYNDQGGSYRSYNLSVDGMELDMALYDCKGVDEGADEDEVRGDIEAAFDQAFEDSQAEIYEAFLSEWDWEDVSREVRRERIAGLLAEDAPSGRALFAAMFPEDSGDLPLLATQLDDLMAAIGSVHVPTPDDRKYLVDVFYGEMGTDEKHFLERWTGWARSAAAAKKAAEDAVWDRRLDVVSCTPRFEVQRMAIAKAGIAPEPSSVYTVRYVIRSKGEDTEAPQGAFWSNEDGWGSLDGATLFSTPERMAHSLPGTSLGDAEWMLLDEAEDLVNGAHVTAAAAEGAAA